MCILAKLCALMVLLSVWICCSRWLLCFLVFGCCAENTKAYYLCWHCGGWHFQSPLEVQLGLPASDYNADLLTSTEAISVQLLAVSDTPGQKTKLEPNIDCHWSQRGWFALKIANVIVIIHDPPKRFESMCVCARVFQFLVSCSDSP